MRRTPRRELAGLPPSLVAEVERRLGAVRGFEPRQGGFSYGVRGIATVDGHLNGGCSRGGRVFLKAVPSGADHAGDYRSEAVVSAALPAAVPAPRLLFSCERDGWGCSARRRRRAGCRTSRGTRGSWRRRWTCWRPARAR
ncbi:hypothetical protein HD597_007625 [Nonomuraea thailandensis]|uniref:Uncharacterized protein n=1 Tax=Nonomuraea thailandensis TaxID=1188745 RepID=A0A9X2GMW0_9ACTN|nr:hypothetical protein [Nonomuraea thailandensis]MCP2360605.1 hypothetical protein [Nonomuraea thailandensis]